MKYLIVGLGNIGEEYRNTRHNVGFLVVEALAASGESSFVSARYGAMAHMKYRGQMLCILKPSTFMNLSGKAVKYWMQQENIPIEQLLIISDDKDLQFGALRMKAKGSGGTHNGLNNIIETIESSDFSRLRFGIGNEFPAGQQIEFVLGTWSPEEQTLLAERTKTAVEIIKSFVVAGVTQTMSRYNNK